MTHFAPRLGIAYQLDPKTVIRTGYGRSYDVGVFGVSFGHNVTQNVPVLANQSLNPANPWLPVFTLNQGPPPLDPTTILATQPKGANGNPILPNGIAPERAAVDQQQHDAAARGGCLELHRGAISSHPASSFPSPMSATTAITLPPGGTNYNVNQPSIVGFGTLSTNQRRLLLQRFTVGPSRSSISPTTPA